MRKHERRGLWAISAALTLTALQTLPTLGGLLIALAAAAAALIAAEG
jgi:hypothetical protein